MTGPLPVAVVGGGIMGRGIAAALAHAGHDVAVVETDAASAATLVGRVAGLVDELPPGGPPGRVVVAELDDALRGAGLVIEAVPEDLPLKQSVWHRIDDAAAPDAILATNTSAFSIDLIAGWTSDPARVLGTHWFNPAQVVPCVEVVTGSATDPALVERIVALLRAAGKEASVVRNSPGFVANRIQFALVREALLCLHEGIVSPDDLDRIVSGSFGIRLAALGPIANADLGGLDTYRSVLAYLTEQLGERFAPPALLDRLVDEGRLGVKTGAGIRDYPGDEGMKLARLRDERLRRLLAAREGD